MHVGIYSMFTRLCCENDSAEYDYIHPSDGIVYTFRHKRNTRNTRTKLGRSNIYTHTGFTTKSNLLQPIFEYK